MLISHTQKQTQRQLMMSENILRVKKKGVAV